MSLRCKLMASWLVIENVVMCYVYIHIYNVHNIIIHNKHYKDYIILFIHFIYFLLCFYLILLYYV